MASSKSFVLLWVALLALTACASPESALKPCPTYGVLHDAETMTAFASAGGEPSGVAYRVTLQDASLNCGTRKDRVVGHIKATILVERGPVLGVSQIRVPYFVAVTRGRQFILAREEFTEGVRLSGASTTEHVDVPLTIPLAEDTTGASYEVIIGLLLTPEQLAFNRRQDAR